MIRKLAGKRDPLRDGTHDWDCSVHYHRCDNCGNIVENRDDYVDRLGSWEKDLRCPRCHHEFTVMRDVRPNFGPFFGKRKI